MNPRALLQKLRIGPLNSPLLGDALLLVAAVPAAAGAAWVCFHHAPTVPLGVAFFAGSLVAGVALGRLDVHLASHRHDAALRRILFNTPEASHGR